MHGNIPTFMVLDFVFEFGNLFDQYDSSSRDSGFDTNSF